MSLWRPPVANRARGEVRVASATLALNLGALAAVEEAFDGKPYEDVFEDVLSADKISALKVRRMMLAIAEGNGADIADEIDAMMPNDLTAVAVELIAAAFPDPGPKKRKAKPANP